MPSSSHCTDCAALPARPARKASYAGLIEAVSAEFGLDAALLHAIVSTESGYDPSAVSKKGAIGLMQVLPATGRRFGFAGLQDPRTNLLAGATYLKWLLARFHGNVKLAVAAYNSGESAVDRYGGTVPPYEETRRYVATVLAKYQATLAGTTAAEPAQNIPAALGRAPASGAESTADAAGTINATGSAGAAKTAETLGTAGPAQSRAGSEMTPWQLLAKLGTLLVSAPPARRG
ncbi:lytic transglycosylase domain-containing protein [Trinickia caryophylli]|uniref:lytic transglycosylase domain-containing protein n=1 Tax=Trinickia caryophylli TaxID=28094 RepID=UPI001B866CDF|nr:lytic transglycosylase domain-containing protein [Trinickia caryophylli]WQE10739.1 lytic transglycosylase domain-containing protein [Trinickia caryophylli]